MPCLGFGVSPLIQDRGKTGMFILYVVRRESSLVEPPTLDDPTETFEQTRPRRVWRDKVRTR